jgi:pyruvate,water dikinase
VEAIVNGDAVALDNVFQHIETLGAVAVRSSGVGEDSTSASFAGQHATVLDVRSRVALAEAIRNVWASGRNAGVLGYRERLGLAGEPRMGIVVQRLVASDRAGVLFTRNPMTGADECVVEAAWGLGEVVVAGLVTPDHYRIARNGDILERSAGDKDIAIRSLPGGGTAEQEVAEHLVNALCLSDADLQALFALAQRCELHHGPGPNDLEFAFDSTQLYLLQCRSITRSASL